MFPRLCFGLVCKMVFCTGFYHFLFRYKLVVIIILWIIQFLFFRSLLDKDECAGTYVWTNCRSAT